MFACRDLLLCGKGSLHEGRRGFSCFVQGLGRRGAQAAPVWNAARLVVVVPWHRPAAQDVLKCPKYSTCTVGSDRNNQGFHMTNCFPWIMILERYKNLLWPPSQAVQLGLAGGECMRKLLLASTLLYLGFSTKSRISANSRWRNPGSMEVPPITTRFSDSTFRASMGHYRHKITTLIAPKVVIATYRPSSVSRYMYINTTVILIICARWYLKTKTRVQHCCCRTYRD